MKRIKSILRTAATIMAVLIFAGLISDSHGRVSVTLTLALMLGAFVIGGAWGYQQDRPKRPLPPTPWG